MHHLLKTKKEYKSLKKAGNTKYIYRNELDKACFQHDTAYGDFKDLAERTTADKFVRDKSFNIAKDSKHDGYRRLLASMAYKYFDKKNKGSVVKSVSQNEQLAKELHKPIILKFEKRKIHSAFKDNI